MNNLTLWFPMQRADVVRTIADGQVQLSLPDGPAVQLNATARALWDLCDGATTPEEMAAAVCDVFDVDPRTAVTQVSRVLRQLASDDFLKDPA